MAWKTKYPGYEPRGFAAHTRDIREWVPYISHLVVVQRLNLPSISKIGETGAAQTRNRLVARGASGETAVEGFYSCTAANA